MQNKLETEAVRKCIENFFVELNEQYNVTVSSISLEWMERIVNSKHDKYYLLNSDINLRI